MNLVDPKAEKKMKIVAVIMFGLTLFIGVGPMSCNEQIIPEPEKRERNEQDFADGKSVGRQAALRYFTDRGVFPPDSILHLDSLLMIEDEIETKLNNRK